MSTIEKQVESMVSATPVKVDKVSSVEATIKTKIDYKVTKSDEGKCLLFYRYTIKDKDGKVLVSTPNYRSHSFVLQFIQWLYQKMGAVKTVSYKSTTGTIVAINWNSGLMTLDSSATTTTYGIQVGTGTTATTIGDYVIETLIAHGTSSGQLQYSATTLAQPSSTSNTTSYIVTRVFSNASAGSITVNEITLVANLSSNRYMWARDVVTPIIVGVGEQLTIDYTMQTNV